MSEENESETVEDEPIDAQFEPASPASDDPDPKRDGPGWRALGITGAVSALIGGVFGVGLTQVSGQFAPGSIATDIETVAESQQTSGETLVQLKGDVLDLERRLDREMQAVAASQGDSAAMESLAAEIQQLSTQVEALQIVEQERGEADGFDLDELRARIETLEEADEDEVTSPRLANRAITALRRRVEEIENRDEFGARIERLEETLAELQSAREEATDGQAELEDLATLKAEIETLKTELETAGEDRIRLAAELEALRSSGEASRQLLEQASERAEASSGASSAVMAILSIEAAARDGRPFQSAYAQLSEALPGNRTVRDLRPIAVRGAPTVSTLLGEFEVARDKALQAQSDTATSDSGDGWGWVRRVLGDSVQVRRSGEASSTVAETLAAAETALARRDLASAVEGLTALDGPPAEALSPWLTRARARLILEDGLDQLRLTLMNAER